MHQKASRHRRNSGPERCSCVATIGTRRLPPAECFRGDRGVKQVLFLACLALGACATPYSNGGPAALVQSGGVNSHWMSDGKLFVEAKGNAFTSDKTILEYVKLRAAEMAIAADYRYFQLDLQSDPKRAPIVRRVSTYAEEMPARTVAHYNRASGSVAATAGPETSSDYRPTRRAVVSLYKQPPQISADQYFDALAIYAQLGRKHIDGFTPINADAVSRSAD